MASKNQEKLSEPTKACYWWVHFSYLNAQNYRDTLIRGVHNLCARWVGGQKSGKFVNVYNIKIVNEGRWVVKNMRKIVNVNCECPLMPFPSAM